MTVTANNNGKVSYAGDGVTTTFPYPHYFLDQTHLRVVRRASGGTEDVLALGPDYTVAGVGDPTGGEVILTAALASSDSLTIKRNIPLTQLVDYLANDGFPAETHEAALDKLTMALQGHEEALARALLLGETDVDGVGIYRANGNRIGNVGTPINADEATNRQYVDDRIVAALTNGVDLQPFAMELLRDQIGVWNGPRTKLTFSGYDLNWCQLFIDGVLQCATLGDYSKTSVGVNTWDFDFPSAVPATSVVYVVFITGETLRVQPSDVGNTVAQWNANKLQGRDVAATAPTDGYVLTWNATANRWEPKTPGAGGGGGVTLAGNNTWTGTQTFANDVTLSGIGRRIYGDFTNATLNNRVYAQSTQPGGTTEFGLLPNATGTDSAFVTNSSADPNNSSVGRLVAGSSIALQSYRTGAGVVRPMDLDVDGVHALRIAAATRNISIGTTTDNGTKLNVNGTVTLNGCAFRATRNGVNFNVPDVTFTKVTFATEEFDQMGFFDLGSSRFQPTIPGKYMVCFGSTTFFGASVANKRMIVVLYKNGVAYRIGVSAHMSAVDAVGSGGAAVIDMNGTTDYVELYVWHNCGATISFSGATLDTYIEGHRIG